MFLSRFLYRGGVEIPIIMSSTNMASIKVENVIVGSFLALVGLFVTCLNLSVLFVLIRCGFLSQKRNGIYILALGNLIGDTVQQLMVCIYVGPTSVAQSFLVSDNRRHPVVMGFAYFFLFAWYEGIIIQALIAIDRLLNVVFPNIAQQISLNAYKTATIMVYVISGATAVLSQFIFPCCTAYIYYGAFGYSYLGTGPNYSDTYIDLPLNSSTTLLMFFCYMCIWWFLRRQRLSVAITMDANARRKHKEGKIALQFGLIASILAFTWISFRVFPLVLPPSTPQFYSLVTLALSGHCASNAFIFLTMNKEFQRCYTDCFRFGSKRRLFYVFNYTPSSITIPKYIMHSTGISSTR